jgi:uncharacterized membrane protein
MVTLDARAGKWVLAALIASLGVNLFVGGMVLGGRFHHPPPGMFQSEGRERGAADRGMSAFVMDRMAGALPREARGEFRRTVGEHRAAMAEADKNFRGARDKLRAAMAAEPFDRAALDAAFAEMRTRMGESQAAMHAALTDAASRLSPEARKRLSEWDPRDRNKDRRWTRDRDRDGPPGP